jgi:hypothetical protein
VSSIYDAHIFTEANHQESVSVSDAQTGRWSEHSLDLGCRFSPRWREG